MAERASITTRHSRKTVQDVFIRVCRDSGFQFDAYSAANLAGLILKIGPFEVYATMPSLDVMKEIAAGTHPALPPPSPGVSAGGRG